MREPELRTYKKQWNLCTSTRPELERSGMGFMFMEAFMDQIHVESAPGVGTTVYMKKQIGHQDT